MSVLTSTPATLATPAGPAPSDRPRVNRRLLLTWCVVAGLVALLFSCLGISVRAADVGAAAVDEPQYLLTATSLWEDGNLDISDERAQGRADAFYDGALPVQSAVLDDGARISPHDPLLPLLLAPAVGLGGWVGAKIMMALMAGLLAAGTAWVLGTRWAVPAPLAGVVALVAGASSPLAVYGHQVYPEVPAALAVVIAVGAIVPPVGTSPPRFSRTRAVVFVLALSALPWLAVKYTLVAASLAVVGLLRMRGHNRRIPRGATLALAVSGVIWLAGHRVLYGGWTAYATGDHFQASGEFGAVGFAPDYLGRSTRLIGLLVDRDYGLAAWQPAWLLVLPALGLLIGISASAAGPVAPVAPVTPSWRRADLAVLLAPLAAGWLTAVFIAVTMHGFWWPGRQVVVVLPLAAMVIAIALARAELSRRRALLTVAAVLAALGVAIHSWVLIAGHAEALTWVGAANVEPPAPLAFLRALLPDYRELAAGDWTLHALWVAAALLLLPGGAIVGRRLPPSPAKDATS